MPKVVAEIGCNHKGDISIAKELIDDAKSAGADVAKFQKRSTGFDPCLRRYAATKSPCVPLGILNVLS